MYFCLHIVIIVGKFDSQKNFKSLPNDKILDCSKLKVFTDDKVNVNVTEKLKFVLVTSIFSFSYHVFKMFSRSLHTGVV